MMNYNTPSAFSNMNRPKYVSQTAPADYRAWKNKDDKKDEKKELNMASFTEFPDLVKEAPKKTMFEGTSLALKLKEVITAEEEAAIQKRLKKGDTPEMLLREGCVSLPCKGAKRSSSPISVPDWVTDSTTPTIIPGFRHKTLAQLAELRKWKRLGINPLHTRLDDYNQEDVYIDDNVSLPSIDDNASVESEQEAYAQEAN